MRLLVAASAAAFFALTTFIGHELPRLQPRADAQKLRLALPAETTGTAPASDPAHARANIKSFVAALPTPHDIAENFAAIRRSFFTPRDSFGFLGDNLDPMSAALSDAPLYVTPLRGIEEVCDAMAAAAREHGIPVDFFARLIWQESRFKQYAMSPVGAEGVAQFMPRTAAEKGLVDAFDPIAALPASARFLSDLRNLFGNIGLAAAAYNGGARRVMEWLGNKGPMPDETRNYVLSITGHPPEKWKQASLINVASSLPKRAPCEGVAGLSREAPMKTLVVELEPQVTKVIADAEAAERAKKSAKAARADKLLNRSKNKKNDESAVIAGKDNEQAPALASGKSDKKDEPSLVIATDTDGGTSSVKKSAKKADIGKPLPLRGDIKTSATKEAKLAAKSEKPAKGDKKEKSAKSAKDTKVAAKETKAAANDKSAVKSQSKQDAKEKPAKLAGGKAKASKRERVAVN